MISSASLLSGQIIGRGLKDVLLENMPFNSSKYAVIDSSIVVVIYNHIYPREGVEERKYPEDIMELQIGSNATKFFSQNLHRWDTRNTSGMKIRTDFNAYEIFTGYPEGHVTEVNRLPYSDNQENYAYYYEEKTPDLQWELEPGEMEILGYACNRAKIDFRGRVWTVWYAPEIPIKEGPWKLRGLPGLILKAEDDSGEFVFEAIGISEDRKSINWYDWNYTKVTRGKWRKFEKSIYDDPLFYMTKGEKDFFVINMITNTNYDDSWSIPYNPIELK